MPDHRPPPERHAFVEVKPYHSCGLCGQPEDAPAHQDEWERRLKRVEEQLEYLTDKDRETPT